MAHVGMWMPTRRDGRNWLVRYTVVMRDKTVNQTRTFRVRDDARKFIENAKSTFKRDSRVASSSFTLEAIE